MSGERTAHVNSWALSALVDACLRLTGTSKSAIARDAAVTPQQLNDLLSGRRAGNDDTLRGRVAGALKVDPRAITCWCDDRKRNHGVA